MAARSAPISARSVLGSNLAGVSLESSELTLYSSPCAQYGRRLRIKPAPAFLPPGAQLESSHHPVNSTQRRSIYRASYRRPRAQSPVNGEMGLFSPASVSLTPIKRYLDRMNVVQYTEHSSLL